MHIAVNTLLDAQFLGSRVLCRGHGNRSQASGGLGRLQFGFAQDAFIDDYLVHIRIGIGAILHQLGLELVQGRGEPGH